MPEHSQVLLPGLTAGVLMVRWVMQAARRHWTVTATGTAACGTRARVWRDGASQPTASMKMVRS